MSLETVLTRLSTNLPGWMATGLNEAQTSQVIVLPILQALGYDIWNPYEVVAEEHSGGGSGAYRPDFTVRIDRGDKFFIEAKALSHTFSDNDKIQTVNYANARGRRWSVLTSGKAWHLFDNHIPLPANDKLALKLELDDQFASAYLAALLGKESWGPTGAEAAIAKEVERIKADMQNRVRLDEIAAKLVQRIGNGFEANERGLQTAIEFTLDSNEQSLATDQFAELAERLLGVSGEPQTKPLPARTSPIGVETASDVIEAIRQGIETSKAFRRQRQKAETELEAYLESQRLEVNGWRDLNAGIAEAMLMLGHLDYLASQNLLNQSREERRKSDGSTYPPSGYRELSNGEFLFLHASAETHKQRIRKMLIELEAPKQLLKVVYQAKEYLLP